MTRCHAKLLFICGSKEQTDYEMQSIKHRINNGYYYSYERRADVEILDDSSFTYFQDPTVFTRIAAENPSQFSADAIIAQDWIGRIWHQAFCVWIRNPSFTPHVIRGLSSILRARNSSGMATVMTSEHPWPVWHDVLTDTEGYVPDDSRPVAMNGRDSYNSYIREAFGRLKIIEL